MKVIPAIDLRDGACVQLVGGSYADERVRLDDPVGVARAWARVGLDTLHVVDLDAATGSGTNAALVAQIIRATRASVNVGGGVRSDDRIIELLDAGAANVVVGTRALEEPAWIEAQANRFPDRLIVAADVRGGKLAVRGWRAAVDRDVDAAIAELSALPLSALLVTAVDVEGSMLGPSLDLIERAVAASRVPVIASGGVGSVGDLRALAERGASAAVIGMALYSGAIAPDALVAEFAV
jgi:phosphoribosylformimino-5-aminoimidazole carboxamide ribotide isomerase